MRPTPPLLKSICTIVNWVTHNFPPAKFPPTPPLEYSEHDGMLGNTVMKYNQTLI